MRAILLIFAITSLVGCGSGGSGAAKSSESTTTTLPPLTPEMAVELALPYFENFAMSTDGGYDRMKDLAAPSSSAYQYYQHQRYLWWALGKPDGADEVRVDGGDIKICNKQTVFDDSCASYTKYSGFQFNADRSKLDRFFVQDESVTERFWKVTPTNCWLTDSTKFSCGSDESFDLEILTAYLSAADTLAITYRFTRGKEFNPDYGMRVKSVSIGEEGKKARTSKEFSKSVPVAGKNKLGYAFIEGLRGALSRGTLYGTLKWGYEGYSKSYEFDFVINR